jgi:hypothetical protein
LESFRSASPRAQAELLRLRDEVDAEIDEASEALGYDLDLFPEGPPEQATLDESEIYGLDEEFEW